MAMPSSILVSPAVCLLVMIACALHLVAVGGQQCVADSSVVLVNGAWDESSAASVPLPRSLPGVRVRGRPVDEVSGCW